MNVLVACEESQRSRDKEKAAVNNCCIGITYYFNILSFVTVIKK